MAAAQAYGMLRIYSTPPNFPKQTSQPQVYFVDVPLLCNQLPLYLGRAKRGKEDAALREYGQRAEAIRASKSNSLLMAHRRTTLSKRQLEFHWDESARCVKLTVLGSNAVFINGTSYEQQHKTPAPFGFTGQEYSQHQTVSLTDSTTILTVGVLIQFCAPIASPVAASASSATAPSNQPSQPAASPSTYSVASSGGASAPRVGGVKRPRSSTGRGELEAALKAWRQTPAGATGELDKSDMLQLLEQRSGHTPSSATDSEAATRQRKRLDRQVRAMLKEGLLEKVKPNAGKSPAVYKVL